MLLQKRVERLSFLLQRIDDPADFTKQVVSAVMELGILHRITYAKTSIKTTVKTETGCTVFL